MLHFSQTPENFLDIVETRKSYPLYAEFKIGFVIIYQRIH